MVKTVPYHEKKREIAKEIYRAFGNEPFTGQDIADLYGIPATRIGPLFQSLRNNKFVERINRRVNSQPALYRISPLFQERFREIEEVRV